MLKDIVDVQVLKDYHLQLRFEDGLQGEVDVARLVDFNGVFAPLRDPQYFSQVRVNSDIGTVCWPNDADLDSDVLYSIIAGQPVPTFTEPARVST